MIDRTEAMTVVDVNTGKFTGQGGNLEETVTRNNLEAAEEIVRQLRLRDIGGIIVIDFIDMVLESNRDLVLRRLLECLGRDRTKHQVAEVTSLGLVQMTRKRVGAGPARGVLRAVRALRRPRRHRPHRAGGDRAAAAATAAVAAASATETARSRRAADAGRRRRAGAGRGAERRRRAPRRRGRRVEAAEASPVAVERPGAAPTLGAASRSARPTRPPTSADGQRPSAAVPSRPTDERRPQAAAPAPRRSARRPPSEPPRRRRRSPV